MPIIIPKALPAYNTLEAENIFVMKEKRAASQDIRPIEIAIVNLMPTKIQTETQLMRLLGNTPLQVNITLINTGSYTSKNTEAEHLDKFYKTFDEVKGGHFDGMIITGAPVETLEFEQVLYWKELQQIMKFAHKNVTSTLYICWGAQAGLYNRYHINKRLLPQKMFGIYKNRKTVHNEPLLKGVDDVFYIPMSRHTAVDEETLRGCKCLQVLAATEYGASIVKSTDNKEFFFFGHSEYERKSLKTEYERDLAKGMNIEPPINYFNPDGTIDVVWRAAASLLFSNWLNYYVYQATPFEFKS